MHLLSGKTLEARRAQRPQTIIQNGSGGFAMEFNGTDEYLQIALPSELASFTPSTISGGNPPTGWSKEGSCTITRETTEPGSSDCMKIVFGSNTGIKRTGILTTGKKYKVSFRYKSTYFFRLGNLTTAYKQPEATSEWNTFTFIFTATGTDFYIRGEGAYTAWIESLTIKEDQGFDLNKDQEQILHSKNADFERTLGAEIATGTVTIGKKYVVTAGTVEGNATGTEFLAVTNATTLDANNKVKEIPNLVTNGTFDSDTAWNAINVTIADGVCHFVDATYVGSYVRVDDKLVIGKRYRVVYEVKNYVKGGSNVRIGLAYGTIRTANGIYTEDLVADGTRFYIYSYVSNGTDLTTLDIDNIHVYEIPEWTASGNHSCDVSTLDKSGTGASNTQSLKVTASGAGNSSNCVTLPSANLESCVSGKKYTLQGEARLDASSLSYGSELITIADDRTFDSDTGFWTKISTSITGGEAVITALSAGASALYRTSFGTIGKTYKITYTVKNYVAGGIRVHMGNYGAEVPRVANGTYTAYITATNNRIDFVATGSATSLSLDDISVVEATPITLTSQLGTKSVTSSALSIVSGTFTKFVLNFEATASEVNQDLKLWLSGAGSVYVDKLSLTQSYDWVNIINFKWASAKNNYTLALGTGNDYIVSTGNGDAKYITLLAASGASTIQAYDNSAKAVGVFHKTVYVLNRTDKAYQYMGGVAGSSQPSALGIGKVIFGGALTVSSGAGGLAFQGQISHIQIIRFENISQSTFNSALTGLQFPIGGGAEEVLRLTFQDGTSINNTLKDYSPKGHTVTGVNIDSTNRKRVN